ncbi:MAG: hypothetical protein JWL83_4056 [Actinomycetia bacterium]|nr:hypothetical protein [Actinomycetes bacterium]
MYNTTLPPLPSPTPPIEAVTPALAPGALLRYMAALAALIVTAAALGWGFTQWSSANSWKHRSQVSEAESTQLEKRTVHAENVAQKAEHATANVRQSLTKTQQRLAVVSNEQAASRDMRVLLCEAVPDLIDPSMRAEFCR